jgi:hypothetical protein
MELGGITRIGRKGYAEIAEADSTVVREQPLTPILSSRQGQGGSLHEASSELLSPNDSVPPTTSLTTTRHPQPIMGR